MTRRPRVTLAMLMMTLVTACVDVDGARRPDDKTEDRRSTPRSESVVDAIPRIVEDVQPSVVSVSTARGSGSGVVYGEGIVVTNLHVVEGSDRVTVEVATGEEHLGEVEAADAATDLAVVRVDVDLPAAEFEEQLPRVGEFVVALGSPLGFENTATAGIVSGLGREIPGSGSRALVDLIQTDAAISPGNSGGALIDMAGRVVGINEAYIPPAAGAVSIGFAIPAATVIDTVEELLDDGSADHAYVGIRALTLTPGTAAALGAEVTSGVVVVDVIESGPADDAGLARGDIIVAFGSQKVETLEAFLGDLRAVEPDDEVDLTVLRNGDRKTVTIAVGEQEAGNR